ncbi:MAG: hypothetical protein ABS942_04125 [Solibacillus sp.]|uniref:hypothetical protein n=1 Tax=Solibacillus sp. TaxID=1909654 RepID=UPI0033149377
MIEDKLQKLKPIRVDEAEKQKDFEQINQRLNKKPFYWQVPAVAFSMVLLVLFLVATMPVSDRETNLSSDPYLYEVLFKDGESDPKSIYYIGVKRSTDEEEMDMMQAAIEALEPLTAPYVPQDAYKTYRLNYSNGEQRVLTEYIEGGTIYLKDLDTEAYYRLAEDNIVLYLMHTKPSRWQYVLFGGIVFLLFGGNWYIDKQMRVPSDPKRKLPMHSDYKQSIALVCYMFVIFFMFMGGISGTATIHIGWLYVIGFIFAAISIAIEQKHDNNGWRKLRFINVALLIPSYVFLFTQV